MDLDAAFPRAFCSATVDWFGETFDSPSEIQTLGWRSIAAGKNTLIAAPTGSGKTLAAFLAAIDDLTQLALEDQLTDETRVVYVSPLKALGNDIERNLGDPLAGIAARSKQSRPITPRRSRKRVRTRCDDAVSA